MQEYLLKVADSATKDVKDWLLLQTTPSHVRLAARGEPGSCSGSAPGG